MVESRANAFVLACETCSISSVSCVGLRYRSQRICAMWSSLVREMVVCNLRIKWSRRERGHWLVVGRLLRSFMTPHEDGDCKPYRTWRKLPLCSHVDFDGNVHRSYSTITQSLTSVAAKRLFDRESLTQTAQSHYEVRPRNIFNAPPLPFISLLLNRCFRWRMYSC